MPRFSDTLTIEDILRRMSRALRKVNQLDLAPNRIAAYRDCGIPSEYIRDYDERAWALESIRRDVVSRRDETTLGREIVESALTLIALTVLVGTIALVIPAHAADGPLLADEWQPLHWLGYFVGGLVAAVVFNLVSDAIRVRRRHED